MNCRSHHLVPLVFFLMIPSLALAITGIPDPFLCTIATRATEDVSVMTCPAGDGFFFSQAQVFGGEAMDATIEIYILDGQGVPIFNFPFEDIWLDGEGLCFCNGGNLADLNTDQNGYTEFALPLGGSGCSENYALVGYVVGFPFFPAPLPHINTNSPDLNCDLIVNLGDLALFAAGYFGSYSYCLDFYWDGVLDLRDLALFAQHFHHQCQ